ncbi:MAG: anaerobic ribonucleoside-triphosphate reductase activating protein [Treponema sp.]|jgi:pyruvate formate lyase activating enzyme|nr:anaerobic ribonucleoside-triphosphate reductase activating protein [Treponema sp.]
MPEASVGWPRFKSGAGVFLRKTTLIDYPGKLASALFFPGCGLRCPWCQNRELVLGTDAALTPLEEALSHLEKRRLVLGGVVLSGGEPTGFAELPALVETIKGMGLSVKLDTNGMNPRSLERLFSRAETRPDYIALDLKLPPGRYAALLPRGKSGFDPAAALEQSALLVRESGIAHEYRTLALPGDYLKAEELDALAPLTDDGPWYFRSFIPGNCLDPAWNDFPTPGAEKAALLAEKAHALGKRGISP